MRVSSAESIENAVHVRDCTQLWEFNNKYLPYLKKNRKNEHAHINKTILNREEKNILMQYHKHSNNFRIPWDPLSMEEFK